MMMLRLKDERGVAALTIMLVTAVLAIAGGVVVLSATTELQTGGRDRRAEDAFTAAEAGLELAAARFVAQPTWAEGQTEECLDNPMVPPEAGLTCEVRVTSSSSGQLVYPPEGRPYVPYTVVSSAKEGRSVARTVASTYRLEVAELPFGMYVNGNLDLNGGPEMARVSLLVNGTVTSRSSLSFDWNDNSAFDDPDLGWRFHKDLLSSDPAPDMCVDGSSGQTVGCSGVFANFQIYTKNTTKNSDEIHVQSDNPALSAFPRDRDVHQTKLDGSNKPIPIVAAATDPVVERMSSLKSIAIAQGLYFNYKDGKKDTVLLQPADLETTTRNFEKNVVAYFDADSNDIIKWKINLIPGSTASDIKYVDDSGQRVGSLSGVLAVRGGSLYLEANTQFSGAAFVPEGSLRTLGGVIFTGTIYADGVEHQGGNSSIQLTPEWLTRFPAGLVDVFREAFAECEPFQASDICPAS